MIFQQLAELSPQLEADINIKYDVGGQLTVSFVPKTSVTVKPLQLVGTPQEMDEGFIAAVTKPLQLVAGLKTNTAEFEQSVNDAASKTSTSAKKDTAKSSSAKTTKKEDAPVEYPKKPEAQTEPPAAAAEPAFLPGSKLIFTGIGELRGVTADLVDPVPDAEGKIKVDFDGEVGEALISASSFSIYKKPEEPAPATDQPTSEAGEVAAPVDTPAPTPPAPARPTPPRPTPPRPPAAVPDIARGDS